MKKASATVSRLTGTLLRCARLELVVALRRRSFNEPERVGVLTTFAMWQLLISGLHTKRSLAAMLPISSVSGTCQFAGAGTL